MEIGLILIDLDKKNDTYFTWYDCILETIPILRKKTNVLHISMNDYI